MRQLALVVAVATGMLAPACGSGTGPSVGAGGAGAGGAMGVAGAGGSAFFMEQMEAARSIAVKDCTAMEQCIPLSFGTRYADRAECVDKNALLWAGLYFGPDSGATVEGVAQCGAELDLSTCTAWWSFNFAAGPAACTRASASVCDSWNRETVGAGPPSCFPDGLREPGESCGSRTQCKSGFCNIFGTPACGQCVAASDEGQSCGGAQAKCRAGLACAFPRCTRLPAVGDPCPGGQCIVPNLVCDPLDGCAPVLFDPPLCDPGGYVHGFSPCRVDHVCNPVTFGCAPLAGRKVGEPCGQLPGGAIAGCERGAACKLSTLPDQTVCVPKTPLGEPCTAGYLFGSGCEEPGDCVEGVCRVRGPHLCPSTP